MFRKLALFVAAAAAFGLLPMTTTPKGLGPFPGSAVALLLAMPLAVAASGADRVGGGSPASSWIALPAAGGALGALAAAVLSSSSPAVIGDKVEEMLRDVEGRLFPLSQAGVLEEIVVSTAQVAR
jgi:hypothetical protein